MKDSEVEWIGYIPSNWELKRIQFSLEEINIKNAPIKTNNVLSLVKDKGVMLYEEKGNKGNKSKNDVSEYKLAYENTLIVNSMNVLIGSVGISKYFGCVSPVYYVFKENVNSDLRFINYIFNTREFQKQLRKYANGILEIRLRVSSYDIFKQKIALPQKSVQNKIADFLDKKCTEIDSLSEDIQKEIDLLEEYKKSVISEAVTKGLNPDVEMKDSGVEYIGTYPSLWTLKKLKYTFKERNERSLTGSELLLSVSQYKGVIPSSENTMRTMQPNSLIGYKKVYKDDLVFNKLNPTLARFGKSEYEGITSPEFSIYIIDSNQLYTKFLEYILRTEKYSKEYGRITLGVGDGYTRLYTNQLGNVYVAVPSLVEQEQILLFLKSIIDEIDKTLSEKKEQLTTLAEYKKSLVYEYVTGKKEVI
ncbi:restriction endonuclease subunit S [Succinivibrio sp.]|uniref:restriction endonuclease subunit S n=1 Tax=Succinivibrio sp. TaxID=2053619 RepID=UPI002F937521